LGPIKADTTGQCLLFKQRFNLNDGVLYVTTGQCLLFKQRFNLNDGVLYVPILPSK